MGNAERVGLMISGSTMILASGDPTHWTWMGAAGLILFLIGFWSEERRDKR